MFRELDTVVLTHDFTEYGLTRGDVGAVVHAYADGKTYEVEFVTGEGKTIAVVTLSKADIRPMRRRKFFTFAIMQLLDKPSASLSGGVFHR